MFVLRGGTCWLKHVFLALPGLRQSEVIAFDTSAASLHTQLANPAECNTAKLEEAEEG